MVWKLKTSVPGWYPSTHPSGPVSALLTHPVYGANLLRELLHPQLDVYFFVPNIIRDRKQTKSLIGIRFVRKLDTCSYPNQSFSLPTSKIFLTLRSIIMGTKYILEFKFMSSPFWNAYLTALFPKKTRPSQCLHCNKNISIKSAVYYLN